MKTTLILAALADSPGTVTEIADVLHMQRGPVNWMLVNMVRNSRYATRSVFRRAGPGPDPYQYQISLLGLRILRQRENAKAT